MLLDAISKSFGTKTLFQNLNFHFPKGERIALFGANGAGKSTLLNIMTGLLEPDDGRLVTPAHFELGYLPQEPSTNPAATVLEDVLEEGVGRVQKVFKAHKLALQALELVGDENALRNFEDADQEFRNMNGHSLEGQACSILQGLGFDDAKIQADPRTLSGGWRMRVELAKIFLAKPDFLVLDEPTNHLDLPSLVWVEKWLQNFTGTLLFVSHDRSLLERLPSMILHLYGGKLMSYTGNFSKFLEQRDAAREQDAAQAATLRKRREGLETFVQKFGAKASKASQAQSKMKMIERIRSLEGQFDDSEMDSIHLNIPLSQPSGREVIQIKNLAVGYSKPLISGISQTIERGQRVAIIGANGIGKSTLLKTLAGRLTNLGGSCAFGHQVKASWFAQDQLTSLDPEATVIDNVWRRATDLGERQIRTLLGSLLFRGDDVRKPLKVLSGGEKARVGLACTIVERSNLLLLDEPTNHLDLSSAEILSQALSDYEGTIVFVSHDRAFIDEICTHVLVVCADGQHALFHGNLDDYQRQAVRMGFPNVFETANISSGGKAKQKAPPSQDTTRKELSRMVKKAEQLEENIRKHEAKRSKLAEELNAAGASYAKLQEVSKEHDALTAKISEVEEEWLTILARKEELEALLT
jgi:ATP-binding cassette subfamily F protein 3